MTTRSISALTSRSTMVGKWSSSQERSIGFRSSATTSSSERPAVEVTERASVPKEAATAALVGAETRRSGSAARGAATGGRAG
jgi:hypothetical protein